MEEPTQGNLGPTIRPAVWGLRWIIIIDKVPYAVFHRTIFYYILTCYMEHTTVNELARAFREALEGGSETAAARLSRLLPRLARNEPELAAALGAVVREGSALRGKVFQQAPVDADSRQKLLMEFYPVELPGRPLFTREIQEGLDRVVAEWRAADRLREAGEHPIRSVLLSGPPGVGKTLSAAWLARTLNLPLLTLDLATVISSYLGKSGTNLRLVLDYAQTRACVLLLDEFDAIAKRRDDDADVGELKRLVTVLLQSIDQWPSRSLLVAATNHGELLDPAVWRRFDLTLNFGLPEEEARCAFLVDRGLEEPLARLLAQKLHGQSLSHLERLIRQARKNAILRGVEMAEAVLEAVFAQGLAVSDHPDRDLNILLRHMQGETSRQIGDALGISHSTVNRRVRSWLGVAHGRSESTDR